MNCTSDTTVDLQPAITAIVARTYESPPPCDHSARSPPPPHSFREDAPPPCTPQKTQSETKTKTKRETLKVSLFHLIFPIQKDTVLG